MSPLHDMGIEHDLKPEATITPPWATEDFQFTRVWHPVSPTPNNPFVLEVEIQSQVRWYSLWTGGYGDPEQRGEVVLGTWEGSRSAIENRARWVDLQTSRPCHVYEACLCQQTLSRGVRTEYCFYLPGPAQCAKVSQFCSFSGRAVYTCQSYSRTEHGGRCLEAYIDYLP